ncbi:hypothetical protein BRARA_E00373 [Brassica rapa]|uniref:Protein kinase domain-containing protein n=1 Tax=Brassica campestris TaxID=3711 RepID=A0A397ZDF7_BRACM|nr:hypothetical protein BRARA_E00373 [Brassica rapa]
MDTSHGKLIIEESASNMNGYTTLTNTKKNSYGQAFNDKPFPFKTSANGTLTSFSFTFFFAIVRGLPDASSDQYLGIFNATNNGESSNQIIAVKLDVHKDDEFGDINDNHVGININGMKSIISAPAGYYDQKGEFKTLSLISGKLLRITILYSHEERRLNVTLSPPAETYHPKQPLLSLNQDLSPYLKEDMYVGFTASTGYIGAIHYMLIWYAYTFIIVPQLDFAIPIFPPYPKIESHVKRIVLATSLTLTLFVALSASALSIFLYKKHKKVLEVLEEWEIACGPHRFAYSELFKATNGFKQILGEGGFGKVFKGTLPGSDAAIAVKRVSRGSSQGMREFLAEVTTIGRLRHPNLVRLLGYCRYREELYLVYDCMPNGSLDKYLYGSDQEQLSWSQRFKIIKDVAYALSNSIMIELVRTGRPTTGTDVYAFGVFMLEVSCGRRMFEPRAESEQAVLPDWVVNRWERGDIEEAVCERIRQDHDKGELELLLKLGVLCSHQAEEVRSHMSTVVKILEGVSELHDNVLDRTEKKEKWYEKYSEVLDSVTMMESVSNFNVTEPIASLERTKLLL